MKTSAHVYLIGAGPGDPGLLTLRGKECIEKADVVIYDYLANRTFLSYAAPSAECIFVGKKGFSEHVTQDEINALIIEKAKEPGVKTLARLKGGDPFVFGRGGEEALALAAEDISFEVVPGVTAGVAAPAYAGIPVTHRNVASSVAFVTGHEDPTKNESAIDWTHLAHGVDTICFYMGIKALPHICAQLTEAGRGADTPVALVRWGTTPSQEVLVSNLGKVVAEVERTNFQAPAIIVVGNVVGLREEIKWFERNRPLLGKKVAVTRSRTQASALTELLAVKGADVFEFPTIEIAPPASYAELDAALSGLDTYNWVVFTSVNGVESAFARLAEVGKDARAFGSARVAAIGPATADELRTYGIVADIVPSEYKAEGVIDALFEAGVSSGDRVLIPRAAKAREVLPETLREKGIEVNVVNAYETILAKNTPVDELIESLKAGEIDVITFTSSSTVDNFVAVLKEARGTEDIASLLEGVTLASIGPITSKTAAGHELAIAFEAEEYTIKGLVDAIEKHA